jgi:hypothetical protein
VSCLPPGLLKDPSSDTSTCPREAALFDLITCRPCALLECRSYKVHGPQQSQAIL